MDPDKVYALTDEQRRKLRLRPKVKHYKKQERTVLSREDMIRFLRERGFRSCGKLDKKRQPTDPNSNDFRKMFGTWEAAKLAAFGPDNIVPTIDSEYIVKAIHQFELWTVQKIRAARKRDPVVFPSGYAIIKHWGSYMTLLEQARRTSLKYVLSEYMKLSRRLGHIPTIAEALEYGLRLDWVLKYCGGKKEMDELAKGMEKQYEREAGSS